MLQALGGKVSAQPIVNQKPLYPGSKASGIVGDEHMLIRSQLQALRSNACRHCGRAVHQGLNKLSLRAGSGEQWHDGCPHSVEIRSHIRNPSFHPDIFVAAGEFVCEFVTHNMERVSGKQHRLHQREHII